MRYLSFYIFAIFFGICTTLGHAQNRPVIDQNFNFHYNAYEHARVWNRCYYNNDTVDVYIKVLLNTNQVSISDITFSAEIRPNYHLTKVLDTINDFEVLSMDNVKGVLMLKRKLTFTNGNIFNFKLNLGGVSKYNIPIFLHSGDNYPKSEIKLEYSNGEMIFEPYLRNDEQIKMTCGTCEKVNVFLYKSSFNAADPPMVTNPDEVSKSLEVDSIFTLKNNDFVTLKNKGLYLFQTDTTKMEGYGARVENPFFPKYISAEELIGPLIYISTAAEFRKLKSSDNKKAALEEFWLSIVPAKEEAKKVMARYYQRVYEANLFFTGHKEGWKTDQGMIYIVFGTPDELIKDEESEEWVYETDIASPVNRFSFIKIKNLFTENHYVLLRNKRYDKLWFREVELWRTGKK